MSKPRWTKYNNLSIWETDVFVTTFGPYDLYCEVDHADLLLFFIDDTGFVYEDETEDWNAVWRHAKPSQEEVAAYVVWKLRHG